MWLPIPRSRVGVFAATLVLIDLPVIVTALVVGATRGFAATYTDVSDWRLQHPWSLVPTVAVAAAAAYRILRRDG